MQAEADAYLLASLPKDQWMKVQAEQARQAALRGEVVDIFESTDPRIKAANDRIFGKKRPEPDGKR